MTNEERDIINQFIARVAGAPAGGQSGPWGGSVPATQPAPALPPIDPEADGFIRQAFQRYPEVPYRITQLAFVQEHALAEAQNRIRQLEWQLQQAQQAAQQGQQAQQAQQAGQQGGGFFSSLFGGRPHPQPQGGPGPAWNAAGPQYQQAPQPQYQPAPPPQYPPGYQPQALQNSGPGFLGSALRTAAGVAGGMVAADALMGLFNRHEGGFGGGYPGSGGPMGQSPWGGGMPAGGVMPDPGYVDQGTWDNGAGGGQSNQDFVDNGTWDQPTDNSGGDANWDTGGGDSNWDSGGGDSGGGSDDSLC
jgi:hypothetical protein